MILIAKWMGMARILTGKRQLSYMYHLKTNKLNLIEAVASCAVQLLNLLLVVHQHPNPIQRPLPQPPERPCRVRHNHLVPGNTNLAHHLLIDLVNQSPNLPLETLQNPLLLVVIDLQNNKGDRPALATDQGRGNERVPLEPALHVRGFHLLHPLEFEQVVGAPAVQPQVLLGRVRLVQVLGAVHVSVREQFEHGLPAGVLGLFLDNQFAQPRAVAAGNHATPGALVKVVVLPVVGIVGPVLRQRAHLGRAYHDGQQHVATQLVASPGVDGGAGRHDEIKRA